MHHQENKKYITLPKTVSDITAYAMHKLSRELQDDWKSVAMEFPELFDAAAIEFIETSLEQKPKAERFLMRLRERAIPIQILYKVLHKLKLESSYTIIENEVPKELAEALRRSVGLNTNKMQQQNFVPNPASLSKALLTQVTPSASNTPSSLSPFQYSSQLITSTSTPQPQQQQQQQPQQQLLINDSLLSAINKDNRLFESQSHLKTLPSTSNLVLQHSMQPSLLNHSDFLSSFSTLNISQPPPSLPPPQQQQQVKYQQSQNPFEIQQQSLFNQSISSINDLPQFLSPQYHLIQQQLIQQKQQQFIEICEMVLPVINNPDEIEEQNNSYVGKFNMVDLSKRGLKYLKCSFNNTNDYFQELNAIKHKHVNLYTPEIILKTYNPNEFCLLYPHDNIQFTLSDYISQIYRNEKHLLVKLSILRGIANGLSYLHSKHVYHGTINNESILIQHVSDIKANVKLSDFKNSLEFTNDDPRLLDDLYHLGLMIFAIVTCRPMLKYECEQYHLNEKKCTNEVDRRNYRFEIMTRFMPTTSKPLETDTYSQLFRIFWAFTSSSFNRDKINLEKLINDSDNSYAKLKADTERQQQQQQQQQQSSVWSTS